MAKKSTQGRLTIPKDIWDLAQFYDIAYADIGFFLTTDSRVMLTSFSIGNSFNLECLGICHFDEKHRFFVPKNVDVYLGIGDVYCFSFCKKHHIYLYKFDKLHLQNRQLTQLSQLLDIL